MPKKLKRKGLPETAHLIVSGISDFGDLMAETVKKEENPGNFKIYILENRKIKPPLEIGDKFLAHLIHKKNTYTAKPIVRTAQAAPQVEYVYGVMEKRSSAYYAQSAEKNARFEYLLSNTGKAKPGDFVKIALEGSGRFKSASVVKTYGRFNLSLSAATLILEKYGIPTAFSEKALAEAGRLPEFHSEERKDYVQIPFVTIDGEDSRDFDDAIAAEKTDLGYRIYVAIADVAFYVREGTALDREAYARGNSVYLPNMVVSMLPEALSNDLCSLNPGKKRAAIVCTMEINEEGKIKGYYFERAVIKSFARLTYGQVQKALEGKNDLPGQAALLKKILPDLYGAFVLLDNARKKRGALELETTEIKVALDKNGVVKSVYAAERFTAHQIVEEFMIAANVAAASALESKKTICMYRVHDKPKEDRLKDLEPLLRSFKMKLPDINAIKPKHFNNILKKSESFGQMMGISEMILRSQAQAAYSPKNIGHFGLALQKYAHFTSPIRRYADLLVHRALIKAYKMPEGGGLNKDDLFQAWEETGAHLSETERRAMNAERDITARFVAAYLEPSVGQVFEVKVSGISKAGLFVSLEQAGAEGLIPMRCLPNDIYMPGDGGLVLKGRFSGHVFRLGEKVKARLCEAVPLSGGLIFNLEEDFAEPKRRRKK